MLLALVLPSPLRAPIVGVLLGVAAGVYPMFCLSYDLGLAAFAAWLALGPAG